MFFLTTGGLTGLRSSSSSESSSESSPMLRRRLPIPEARGLLFAREKPMPVPSLSLR